MLLAVLHAAYNLMYLVEPTPPKVIRQYVMLLPYMYIPVHTCMLLARLPQVTSLDRLIRLKIPESIIVLHTGRHNRSSNQRAVSYTHLTLPTIYSV